MKHIAFKVLRKEGGRLVSPFAPAYGMVYRPGAVVSPAVGRAFVYTATPAGLSMARWDVANMEDAEVWLAATSPQHKDVLILDTDRILPADLYSAVNDYWRTRDGWRRWPTFLPADVVRSVRQLKLLARVM